MRILLLGGTEHGRRMAEVLAAAGLDAVCSLAGRTASPAPLPLPVRTGGFGGADGLALWLADNGVRAVIDATHPFAARISANAAAAAKAAGVPLIALERPRWRAGPGDRWTVVPDVGAAADALPDRPARVFLAIGRQHLAPFAARPEHRYLLRLVDPPGADLPLPGATAIVDRGPFSVAGDLDLMQRHGVTVVVARNAGGAGAHAKIEAARRLGLPVVMIDRPALPDRPCVERVDEAMDWLHGMALGA